MAFHLRVDLKTFFAVVKSTQKNLGNKLGNLSSECFYFSWDDKNHVFV